jgi:hypothetical protein
LYVQLIKGLTFRPYRYFIAGDRIMTPLPLIDISNLMNQIDARSAAIPGNDDMGRSVDSVNAAGEFIQRKSGSIIGFGVAVGCIAFLMGIGIGAHTLRGSI